MMIKIAFLCLLLLQAASSFVVVPVRMVEMPNTVARMSDDTNTDESSESVCCGDVTIEVASLTSKLQQRRDLFRNGSMILTAFALGYGSNASAEEKQTFVLVAVQVVPDQLPRNVAWKAST